MKLPAIRDIVIDIRTDFHLSLIMTDTSGVAVDISSGYTFSARAGGGPLEDGEINLSPTITSGPAGEITLSIPKAETALLSPNDHLDKEDRSVWDLIVNDGTYTDKLIKGVATITNTQATES